MSNDTDHSVAMKALGWKTLKVERKKAKAKMMYKLLNNMGPQSPGASIVGGGGMGGTRSPQFLEWGGRISNCPPPFFHMFNEI